MPFQQDLHLVDLVDEKAKQNKAELADIIKQNKLLEQRLTTSQDGTKTILDAASEQNQLLSERVLLLEQTCNIQMSSTIEKRLDSLDAKFDTLSKTVEILSASVDKLSFAFLAHDLPRDESN